MIRTILTLGTLLIFASCASRNDEARAKAHEAEVKKETKAAQFDNYCGMNLCLKKQRVKCDPTVTLDYKGKQYCFENTKARDKFAENIDYNIRTANEQWIIMGPR